jgi:hypothetical protein
VPVTPSSVRALLRAVSANLGRRVAAVGWARQIIGLSVNEAVGLVFLQEVPLGEDWTGICDKAGFGFATPAMTPTVYAICRVG